MNDKEKSAGEFIRLLQIMDELRDKCPWDKKQTNDTLRKLTIEETYELADAIISGDDDAIRGELGDLMLHIVFYAKMGEEKGSFNITDVLNGICQKLIYRHPHVFGDTKVNSDKDVIVNWEKLKANEQDEYRRVLSGVPDSLPATI
ncbi:MAG TPA: nucleoside triphosphate pyrophosphohydrolase, partial [Bacteroidetes bacterium]|nr:nucleoside triphosphate pyrophosphohydrolase [Bacteroidota bacterium]